MRNYDAKLIITHSWPKLETLPDGKSKRTWTVAFREEPANLRTMDELSELITGDIVEELDSWFRDHRGPEWLRDHPNSDLPSLKGDLTIELYLSGPKEITANLISVEDGQRDEYLSAALLMLRYIDSRVGIIASIDGHPRGAYPPFSWEDEKANRQWT